MPISSEFIRLCQAQISLVASLGASFGVVYLAENWIDDSSRRLIPVASYPETAAMSWENLVLMPGNLQVQPRPERLLPEATASSKVSPALEENDSTVWDWIDQTELNSDESSADNPVWHTATQRLVLPLIHEEMVMGFLVIGRADRAWEPQEDRQIQAIAHTLTHACVLDRRAHWFQGQLQHHRHLQTLEYDTLHSVLHQLKSPLTALKTFGKLLAKRLLPGDRNHSVAEGIIRESDRLKELLEQIHHTLDQVEGQPQLRPVEASTSLLLLPAATPGELQWISLETILNPLIDSTKAIADDRNLGFSTQILQPLPPIQVNPQGLREVLSNILDNGLKYTPSGGRIHLQVGFQAQSELEVAPLEIVVSDSGVGIPAEDLEYLFQRGYRGVQAQGNVPGTGLGLAIARHLIQQMAGEIDIISPHSIESVPDDFPEASSTLPGTSVFIRLKG
ncbi:MAG: HAMP domain-containing histidine kinase [Oscillatoriales cyanobacterium RM1_1_9]|nr:HAMP domain-containing histidine kinase [Oscillatoriales cyanobacterium SM2_3_0]NJO44373.1 HAMP domain-containing histidine kinase [Oscillatoriales cyanobacterium RM2_1_1]NJO71561.1 HAMP domain-containing histidine kinase [Oscillatoriales cyanobacterium RM1_1_9]